MTSINWKNVYGNAPASNQLSEREQSQLSRFENSMERVFARHPRADLQGIGKFQNEALQLVLHVDSPQGVEPGTYDFDKAQGAGEIAEDIAGRLSDVYGSSAGPSNIVMVEGNRRKKYGQHVIEFPIRSVFSESSLSPSAPTDNNLEESFQKLLQKLKQLAPPPQEVATASLEKKAAYGLHNALYKQELSQAAEKALEKAFNDGRLDDILQQAGQFIKAHGGTGYAKRWANKELVKREDDTSSVGNMIESYVQSGSGRTLSEADFSGIRDKGELFVKWERFRDQLPPKKALRAVLEWMGNHGAQEAFEYVARMHDMRDINIDNRSKWGDLMDQFLRAGWDAKELADELVMGMGTGEIRRMLEDQYSAYGVRESRKVQGKVLGEATNLSDPALQAVRAADYDVGADIKSVIFAYIQEVQQYVPSEAQGAVGDTFRSAFWDGFLKGIQNSMPKHMAAMRGDADVFNDIVSMAVQDGVVAGDQAVYRLAYGRAVGQSPPDPENPNWNDPVFESSQLDEGQWIGMSSGDIKLQPGTIYYFGASRSPDKVLLDQIKGDRVTYYTFDVEGNATQRSEQKDIFRDLAAKGSQTWLDSGRAKYFPEIARSLESLLNGERAKQVDVQEYIRNQERFKVTVRPTKEDSAYDRDDPWYSAENYGNVTGLGDDKLEITLVQRKSDYGPDLQDLRNSDKFEILDTEKH